MNALTKRWGLLLLGLVCALPVQAQTVVRYYHTDALGSVVAVTDAAGSVVERREYEPYGAQLTPAVQDGPGYTGHVQDAATGLVYMQQRYYDAEIGVFLSVDPVTALSSPVTQFHRYRYANNNPYKFIDPDGRLGCTGTHIQSICKSGGVAGLQTSARSTLDAGPNKQSSSSRSQRVAQSSAGGGRTSSGAPTKRIDGWMRSSNPNEKIRAAMAAAIIFKIDDSDYSYRYSQAETTASANVGANNVITLYSPAFKSWSWLGSTLGHEIEGHAGTTDFSNRGLWQSEQRAWRYSLQNIQRFGNTPAEAREIEHAADYYNSHNYDE